MKPNENASTQSNKDWMFNIGFQLLTFNPVDFRCILICYDASFLPTQRYK